MRRGMNSGWRAIMSLVLFVTATFASAAKADVPFTITMNYDATGTGQFAGFAGEFQGAMTTIEGLLHSWSGPRAIESQYSGFTIDIVFDALDGAGGVLAQAGPTDVLRWGGPGIAKHSTRGAVARAGTATFDTDDMAFMAGAGLLRSVIIHETFHALGFAPLWDDFGYRDPTGFGYIGPAALAAYREASGQPYAPFVPLETAGGGGTAGGHWSMADPVFFDPRREHADVMIGFVDPNMAITDITLAQFRDLGYTVPSLGGGRIDDIWPSGPILPKPLAPEEGDDDDGIIDPTSPGTGEDGDNPDSPGTPRRPGSRSDDWVDWMGTGRAGFGSFSAVPEPNSLAILMVIGAVQLVRYRRRK